LALVCLFVLQKIRTNFHYTKFLKATGLAKKDQIPAAGYVLTLKTVSAGNTVNKNETRMWANAQRDGRPAEHRWRPLFNAAKFG